MSWSLAIQNGDLSLDGGSYDIVTGVGKMTQDIRCAILEPMGNDLMHLGYGSVIDGGIRPDGVYVESVLGETDPTIIRMVIEGELHRIISEYQLQQLDRTRQDRMVYNKSTLTADEIVAAIRDIQIFSFEEDPTTMVVRVFLKTGSGAATPVSFTLSS